MLQSKEMVICVSKQWAIREPSSAHTTLYNKARSTRMFVIYLHTCCYVIGVCAASQTHKSFALAFKQSSPHTRFPNQLKIHNKTQLISISNNLLVFAVKIITWLLRNETSITLSSACHSLFGLFGSESYRSRARDKGTPCIRYKLCFAVTNQHGCPCQYRDTYLIATNMYSLINGRTNSTNPRRTCLNESKLAYTTYDFNRNLLLLRNCVLSF